MAVKNLSRVNTYLTPKMISALDALAQSQGVSRSEMLRQCIELGLNWGGWSLSRSAKPPQG